MDPTVLKTFVDELFTLAESKVTNTFLKYTLQAANALIDNFLPVIAPLLVNHTLTKK